MQAALKFQKTRRLSAASGDEILQNARTAKRPRAKFKILPDKVAARIV